MVDAKALWIDPVVIPDDDYADLPSLIRRHADAFPEKPALRVGEVRQNWARLAAAMDATAQALRNLGIGPGDVVAILGEPSAGYLHAFLGTLAAGGAAAPLPVSASDTALATMLADSGAKVLAASSGLAARGAALVAGARPAAVVQVGLDGAAGPHGASLPGMAETAAAGDRPAIAPEALFNIIYSSGTTGTPKGIVHDHLFRNRQLRRMREFGLDESRTTLVSTAMYSNTTLVAALAALGNGGTLVMMPKFTPAGFLDLMADARPTHTTLVPVQIQRILADPAFGGADLSSLISTVVTSSRSPAQMKREMMARWPGRLYEMYGMTEGGLTSSLDLRANPEKIGSVGMPAKAADIRIIGPDDTEVPAGETGEVVGRSPIMMRGYHRQPELTARSLVRLDNGSTYLRTGDLGHFDPDGFLHLSGRTKDVIISGGYNIYASDLEEVLLTDPAVLHASVIGVPSPDWGETPVGYVVLRAGAETGAEALRSRANDQLGKVQRLSEVRIVEALPLNGLGKVIKADLRRLWQDQSATVSA